MTFYPQPTAYECGPFALKHALTLVGTFAEERRIALLAGTTTAGTDEVQLGRAASAFGFDLPTRRAHDSETARRDLEEELGRGRPVLACVDHWSHWITVAAQEGDRYVIADSAEDGVFRVWTWSELGFRWGYREATGAAAQSVYDLNPLVSRGATRPAARISSEHARRLGGDRREVGRDWSSLAADLLPLAEPACGSEDDPVVLPVSSLLEANRAQLLDRVDGRGPTHRAAAREALERVVSVAGSYDLRVLPRHRDDAVRQAEAVMRRMAGRREKRPRRWRAPVVPLRSGQEVRR